MNFPKELLFFFSALGVFNALLICFYFFFVKKEKNRSDIWFGVLLLMLAMRVGKSVFYYFNRDLAQGFIRAGLYACILIGPSLYFYFRSIVFPQVKQRFWLLHFTVLLAISFWISYRFPDTHNPMVFGFHWMRIIYAIWFLYILAAGWTILPSFRKIFQKEGKVSALDFWLIGIFMGNFIIWLAYYLVGYISYIVGALSFSFIFYVLVTLIYFRKNQSALFDKSLKYANKTIDTADIETITQGLKVLMEEEKIYIQPDLKLSDLASKIKVSTHTLSQFLNERLGKSFPSYINEYRIQEAKQLIQSDHRIKLEAVAYDSGFNSKSTFNSAFKKITGVTPSKFKEQLP